MKALTRWFEGLLTTPVTLLVAFAEPGGGRLMLLDDEEREDRAPSLDPPPPPSTPVPPNISNALDTSTSSVIASELVTLEGAGS